MSCRTYNFNKLKLDHPVKSCKPGKKKMVRVKINNGTKIIHYGAVGYRHDYSFKANKNFRSRMQCDRPIANDKTSARHWACEDLWPKSSWSKEYKLEAGGSMPEPRRSKRLTNKRIDYKPFF